MPRPPFSQRACPRIFLLLAALLLPACRTGGPLAPPAVIPGYNELAQHYNARITAIDRLWSAAVVEMSWSEQGRHRWEQGDGNLILVLPDRVSLSVGKLGNILMWAGSDAERFWFFDLQGDKTAYVGRHRTVGNPCARELPTPIRPLELVRLLGITPLTTEPNAPAPPVEWHAGAYLVEPPGMGVRILIDPKTWLARRIDLLDERGFSRVTARLSAPEPVEIVHTPPGALPRMNTRIEIADVTRRGRMVLYLSRLSDGNAWGKIDDRVFDFDRLAKLLKPQATVVLDKDCDGE